MDCAGSAERWFDGVWIETSAESMDEDAVERKRESILFNGVSGPVMLDDEELQATEFEKQVLAGLSEDMNVLRARFGLQYGTVSPSRLHIVPEDIYDQIFGHSNGVNVLGHIYLCERLRSDLSRLVYAISHELAHLHSYSVISVRLCGDKRIATANSLKSAEQPYTGFQIMDRMGNREFAGLNEAVTEYTALLLRRILANRDSDSRLSQSASSTCSVIMAYKQTVSLMIALIRSWVAQGFNPAWNSVQDVWWDLISDYLTGDTSVMDLLSRISPGVYRDLRQLGVDGESAQDMAARHGLTLSYRG